VNLAPLLAMSLDPDVTPADDAALGIWRDEWDQATDRLGDNWLLDDAVDWIRQSLALSGLFRAPTFNQMVEAGPSLALVNADPAASGSPSSVEGDWRSWDEAVALRESRFLLYPNDAEWTPNLSFYAPVVHGDMPRTEPIRLATLVLELVEVRVVSRVRLRDDADGKCARYLVTSDNGDRDLGCEPLSCPRDCATRTWVRPGGIRRSRCEC
jgi:hypothetical protein